MLLCFFPLNTHTQNYRRPHTVSLVLEEDVEDVRLVLEALRVLQQPHQRLVVDAAAGRSGNAALQRRRRRLARVEGGRGGG